MTFTVSDELARQIGGAVASGREMALIFVLKDHEVLEVRAQDVWRNTDASRKLDNCVSRTVG